jgi:hypothetical protein
VFNIKRDTPKAHGACGMWVDQIQVARKATRHAQLRHSFDKTEDWAIYGATICFQTHGGLGGTGHLCAVWSLAGCAVARGPVPWSAIKSHAIPRSSTIRAVPIIGPRVARKIIFCMFLHYMIVALHSLVLHSARRVRSTNSRKCTRSNIERSCTHFGPHFPAVSFEQTP